jgi:hypothetical protein
VVVALARTCSRHDGLVGGAGAAIALKNPMALSGFIPALANSLALLVVAVLTIGAVVFSILVWRDSRWTTWGRLHYTALALASVASSWWLCYWKLLGWYL